MFFEFIFSPLRSPASGRRETFCRERLGNVLQPDVVGTEFSLLLASSRLSAAQQKAGSTATGVPSLPPGLGGKDEKPNASSCLVGGCTSGVELCILMSNV